ncbi:MAG: MarC family protein [Candidatus Omnitrophica bacterium]|nr:MarC family protein [Candidatus Omnitrophota bacterium]MDD5352936.1 MarC family protein [Candidatus Omnitrophota bacterium]MDD5550535.1 MarC family protein [Candidatus Omnitrophota bacterium]
MNNNYLLAFIPIFVAVDAIGVLPIFISLTEGIKKINKRRIILNSSITAIILAVAFIFLGKAVFKVLGITIGDFMIAGGFILFCIAIRDILIPGKQHRVAPKELGAVPLGIPLIVGPAVLTTSLILIAEYGMAATLVSVVANVVLAGLIFMSSDILIKILGENGTRALSKVTSLLLAAIAVMMIRKGVMIIIGNA